MDPTWLLDTIFVGLDAVFKSRLNAPLIFFPLFMIFTIFFWIRAWLCTRPYWSAVSERIGTLEIALGADRDPDSQRRAFAEEFNQVSAAMCSGGHNLADLHRAWAEFRECIIDETASPIFNTARPWPYFQRAIPRRKELLFWSNFFVGLGLVLTFFGIVVALNAAAQGMHQGATVQESQAALRDLLIVASAKFFASIGGLIGSLILRAADASLDKRSQREVHRLCTLLERGLSYMPMQRLGGYQLEELKRQSAQLEKFNTDLALSIGEQVGKQFQNVIIPVHSALDSLNVTMQNMNADLGDKLGKGAGDAIARVSGDALQALANTLSDLKRQLERLPTEIGDSGGDAASQIRAAGADFRTAAADIVADAAQRLRDAASPLVEAVQSLSTRLTHFTENVETARRHTERTAESFLTISDRTRDAAGSLSEAATGFVRAANPVATASQSLSEATAAIRNAITQAEKSGSDTHQALREVGQGIRETQEAAAIAWRDYRSRFETVDDSLERVLLQFSDKLGESMVSFARYAEKFDSELAKALNRLYPVVEVIEENSSAIEALADAMRGAKA